MNEWLDKPLWDRIYSLWTDVDAPYARLNDARDTIIERFRPDLDLDTGSSYDARLLGHDIYDGTGVYAAHTMAVGFQAHQYSKSVDWLDYKFRLNILNGVDELDIFRADIKDHMLSTYQRGNFYDTQLNYAKNAITLGSPCSFGEEDINTGEIFWKPLHYKNYRLFYDQNNRCVGVIIKEKWKIKDVYDKFAEGYTREQRIAKAKEIFSKATVKLLESGKLSDEITIWRAVFKKNHPLWYGFDFGQRYSYWSAYFEDTPLDKNKPLIDEGYFTKPFVIWDYEKNPWESAARTPAFYCLYDDVALNQIMYNYILNTQLKSQPPMAIPMELKDQYTYGPKEEIYLERDAWEYQPKPIEMAGELRHENEILQIFRSNVERHFHTKLFNILTELALTKAQPLSATQALEIQDEKITQISPMIESNDNYLWQVNERAMDIEFRAGRGPFRKDNLEYISDVIRFVCQKNNVPYNGELVPEFVGKLRRQQLMEVKLKPLNIGMEYIAKARQMIDPDLNVAIRGYSILDKGLEAINFPMDILKPEKEYQEDYSQLMESRAQQQQFSNAVEMAKATKGQNAGTENQ